MTTLAKLLVNLSLDSSDVAVGLDDATNHINKFSGGLNVGLAALSAVSVGVTALGAVAAAGTKAFIDFDKGMAEVFTLMPTASQAAFDAMSSDVQNFAIEFGVLPEKVIPGLYQALSSGVPADNVFTFLETAQKAATAGVTDLQVTVDGLTSVVNAYGASTITAAQASDQMFAAVVFGKTTFEELSSTLYNVNPIAASLGVAFGDVTSAIAAMTAQGVPTAQTTTQLRNLLSELGDTSTDAGKKFRELAGVGFKEFIANGGNLQQALQIMESGAAKTGKGVNELFGSIEAGSAALALTGKSTQIFTNALNATANSVGATDKAFNTMNSTLAASFDKIKAAGSVFLTLIGTALAPALTQLADGFVKIAQSKGAIDFVKAFGAGLAAAIEFIGSFRMAVVNLIKLAFGWGNNVGGSFADGIIASGKKLIAAMQNIGRIVASWLKPGSPPKITPELDQWGAQAATVYFDGWAQGDTSAFNTLASTLESTLKGLVDVGKFGQEGVIPTVLAGRAGLQRIFTEIANIGDVSQETFDSVIASMGPVGGTLSGLVRSYINLAKATRAVEQAQNELNETTAKYDQMLAPLSAEMQALQDREKEIRDMQRIQELNEVLADGASTDVEKELARNEIAQIGLQQRITGVERERDTALDAAQAKLDVAKAEETAAQAQVQAQSQAIDNQNTTNQLIGQQLALIEQLAQASASAGAGGGAGSDVGMPTALPPIVDSSTTAQLSEATQLFRELDQAATDTTTAMGETGPAVSGMFDPVNSALTTVQDSFGSAFAYVQSTTSGVVGAVGPVLDKLWANIQLGASHLVPLGALFTSTFATWGPIVTVAVTIVMGALLGIVGFFSGILPGAMLAVSGVLQVVMAGFKLLGDVITGIVNTAVALWNGDFVGALEASKKMFGDIFAGIGTILGGFVKVIWGLIGGLIAGVIEFFKTLYIELVGASIVPEMIDAIIEFFSTLPEKILDFIAGMVTDVIAKFIQLKDDATREASNAITNVGNAISNGVSAVVSSATKIGKAVIDGIKKGISDAWNGIVSWIKGKFSGLVDAGMSAIGAKSPSEMFAKGVGVNAILGVIEGMKRAYPQALAWIKGNLGTKLANYLKEVAGMARSQMDVFVDLFNLSKAPDTFQPLVDATKAYNDSISQSTNIAEKLAEINQKIADAEAMQYGANERSKQLEQQNKLRDLYADQAELLAEQAKNQDAIKNNLAAQLTAEAQRNEQNNQLLIISEDARRMYEEAQARAMAMMKTDAKGALEFFNERKRQIAELADLQRTRALSTDPKEQAMLDTQLELLKAVIAAEQAGQEATLNIKYPGGKDDVGEDRIMAILLEALRKNGIKVDIDYRTI